MGGARHAGEGLHGSEKYPAIGVLPETCLSLRPMPPTAANLGARVRAGSVSDDLPDALASVKDRAPSARGEPARPRRADKPPGPTGHRAARAGPGVVRRGTAAGLARPAPAGERPTGSKVGGRRRPRRRTPPMTPRRADPLRADVHLPPPLRSQPRQIRSPHSHSLGSPPDPHPTRQPSLTPLSVPPSSRDSPSATHLLHSRSDFVRRNRVPAQTAARSSPVRRCSRTD